MYILLVFFAFLLYFGYTRLYQVYSTINYYSKGQGVPFHRKILPIFGSFLELIRVSRSVGRNHPVVDLIEQVYKTKDGLLPQMTGIVFGKQVCLVINRPEAAEEVLLNKNKYFDKHPSSLKVVQKAIGESLIFAHSDILWSKKRKALSASLYKDKLKSMVETIKEITIRVVEKEWIPKKEIDIVKEASKLFMQITLTCLFGKGNENITVKQRCRGVEKQEHLGEVM